MKVLIVLVAAVAACSANYGGHGHYTGPLASPVVNPNGFLADTPEVAAAKAAHLGEYAKAGSPAPYAAPAYSHYSAPAPAHYAPAAPAPAYNHYAAAAPAAHGYNGASVTPQGFLADTPDVAAAKAAHFAEVAKTQTNPSYGPESYDDGSYRPEYENPNYGKAPAAPAPYAAAPAHYASAPAPYAAAPAHYASAPAHYAPAPAHGASHYTGPLAAPVVTPQGFLAETPEVAAAKAAHFAEFAKAGSPAAHHYRRRRSAVVYAAAAVPVQTPASTVPLAAPAHIAYAAPAPLAYAAPAHYAYPYAYSHPYQPLSGFSYSVSSW